MEPPASAPAWQTGAVACRDDPMVGVPHPTRFVVVARCSTVSGTVRQVRRDPADGELNLLIAVDQRYAQFLPVRPTTVCSVRRSFPATSRR